MADNIQVKVIYQAASEPDKEPLSFIFWVNPFLPKNFERGEQPSINFVRKLIRHRLKIMNLKTPAEIEENEITLEVLKPETRPISL